MLDDLIQRKAKADALPAETREKYRDVYDGVCSEIETDLIALAVAADRYSAAFAKGYPSGDLNGLADAAREIIEIVGKRIGP